MKKIWALLPVTALLMLSACGSDSDVTENVKPEPQNPTGAKQIGFKVRVDNSTRASIAADQETLSFAEGDQLLIKGENISGLLPMKSGAGSASAVFEGTLDYTGSGDPSSDLALTATLISSTNVGVNTTTGAVDYGTAICSTLEEAVAKYCLLTGTSTFGSGEATFHLEPQTAFLNFTATLPKGYPDGYDKEPVTVTVGGTAHTGNATISVVGDAAPVANFVVPVAASTSLSGATVKVGRFAAVAFGSGVTTSAKVYNVNKTFASTGSIPDGVNWVQLWDGGPFFADRNVGATSVATSTATAYGSYFAWGEVSTKENYATDWSNYEWGTSATNQTKYTSTSGDGLTELLPEDDAAYWNWGDNCRMATREEFNKLISTDYTDGFHWEADYNGVAGWLIRGRTGTHYENNSIFLPAAGQMEGSSLYKPGSEGYYWSSSLVETWTRRPWDLFFDSGRTYVGYSDRCGGHSVRPVRTNL